MNNNDVQPLNGFCYNSKYNIFIFQHSKISDLSTTSQPPSSSSTVPLPATLEIRPSLTSPSSTITNLNTSSQVTAAKTLIHDLALPNPSVTARQLAQTLVLRAREIATKDSSLFSSHTVASTRSLQQALARLSFDDNGFSTIDCGPSEHHNPHDPQFTWAPGSFELIIQRLTHTLASSEAHTTALQETSPLFAHSSYVVCDLRAKNLKIVHLLQSAGGTLPAQPLRALQHTADHLNSISVLWQGSTSMVLWFYELLCTARALELLTDEILRAYAPLFTRTGCSAHDLAHMSFSEMLEILSWRLELDTDARALQLRQFGVTLAVPQEPLARVKTAQTVGEALAMFKALLRHDEKSLATLIPTFDLQRLPRYTLAKAYSRLLFAMEPHVYKTPGYRRLCLNVMSLDKFIKTEKEDDTFIRQLLVWLDTVRVENENEPFHYTELDFQSFLGPQQTESKIEFEQENKNQNEVMQENPPMRSHQSTDSSTADSCVPWQQKLEQLNLAYHLESPGPDLTPLPGFSSEGLVDTKKTELPIIPVGDPPTQNKATYAPTIFVLEDKDSLDESEISTPSSSLHLETAVETPGCEAATGMEKSPKPLNLLNSPPKHPSPAQQPSQSHPNFPTLCRDWGSWTHDDYVESFRVLLKKTPYPTVTNKIHLFKNQHEFLLGNLLLEDPVVSVFARFLANDLFKFSPKYHRELLAAHYYKALPRYKSMLTTASFESKTLDRSPPIKLNRFTLVEGIGSADEDKELDKKVAGSGNDAITNGKPAAALLGDFKRNPKNTPDGEPYSGSVTDSNATASAKSSDTKTTDLLKKATKKATNEVDFESTKIKTRQEEKRILNNNEIQKINKERLSNQKINDKDEFSNPYAGGPLFSPSFHDSEDFEDSDKDNSNEDFDTEGLLGRSGPMFKRRWNRLRMESQRDISGPRSPGPWSQVPDTTDSPVYPKLILEARNAIAKFHYALQNRPANRPPDRIVLTTPEIFRYIEQVNSAYYGEAPARPTRPVAYKRSYYDSISILPIYLETLPEVLKSEFPKSMFLSTYYHIHNNKKHNILNHSLMAVSMDCPNHLCGDITMFEPSSFKTVGLVAFFPDKNVYIPIYLKGSVCINKDLGAVLNNVLFVPRVHGMVISMRAISLKEAPQFYQCPHFLTKFNSLGDSCESMIGFKPTSGQPWETFWFQTAIVRGRPLIIPQLTSSVNMCVEKKLGMDKFASVGSYLSYIMDHSKRPVGS